MALTVTQQIKIINGDIAPPDYSLNQLVEQISISTAREFNANSKTIDTMTHSLAGEYLHKMTRASTSILQQNAYVIELSKVIISLLGESPITEAQTVAANNDGWEAFIESNMLGAIESVAGVVSAEKTEYDNLP